MKILRRTPSDLRRYLARGAVFGLMVGGSLPLQSQTGGATSTFIGGIEEDRQRIEELVGHTGWRNDFLLRALSRSTHFARDSGQISFRMLPAELRLLENSALPSWQNDGPLRVSRGLNAAVTVGVQGQVGPFRLILAPQFISEQNLDYQVIPYPQVGVPDRNVWANPYHPLPESIDLPFRFGDRPHRRLDAGQSSVTLTMGKVQAGIANENIWWGPGIRNAIILSNNAAGFPHVLFRSPQPISSPVGVFNFDAIYGRLRESEYFDLNPDNDQQDIAGGALSWRLSPQSGLQLGASRLQISGSNGEDRMSSLFGRWAFPDAGFETYFEWARFSDPKSVRDLLEFPNHTQGYTYGIQWARRLSPNRSVRLQTEVSYLEPSASIRLRPVTTSYTSAKVPQGFTNRGEVLGAAIGPGSSSQWVSGDLFNGAFRFGAFANRVRYDNGTFFNPIIPQFALPDVTMQGGLRLGARFRKLSAVAEFSDATRFNYLYQAYVKDPILGLSKGIDLVNRSFSLTMTADSGTR